MDANTMDTAPPPSPFVRRANRAACVSLGSQRDLDRQEDALPAEVSDSSSCELNEDLWTFDTEKNVNGWEFGIRLMKYYAAHRKHVAQELSKADQFCEPPDSTVISKEQWIGEWDVLFDDKLEL
jgi:hypothetical protein